MTQATTLSYDVCDACRRPILREDGIRLIHSFRIHLTDECFNLYMDKVERNMLKVPFNLDHKNSKKTSTRNSNKNTK